MKKFSTLIAAAVLVLSAAQAQAVPITYTFSGDISGNLGGVAFQNKSFTAVFEGDTDNVIPGTPGAPSFNTARNNNLVGTFTIADIGSGAFTDPVGVRKASSQVFFTDGTGADPYYLVWGGAYDLTTETSVSGLVARRQNNSMNTNLGVLNITATNSTGSFTAALVQADVPEPATMALLGLGLTGIGLSKLRRSNKVA